MWFTDASFDNALGFHIFVGAGMVKGSSFGIDTSFSTSGSTAGVSNHRGVPKLSRVHGAGLIVDLDVLEVKACGGTIKYSPTQIEFVSAERLRYSVSLPNYCFQLM
jgi:hypothetical protein